MSEANENGQTAVARYEPKKAIQSAGTLKSLLLRQEQTIRDLIPQHLDPERVMKLALIAVNKTPALLNCTQESVLQAVITAAELGLSISGTLGEAYLIPYGRDCTFIPGFRGLAKLARQSGEIKRIEAEVVYENDKWEYQKGTTFVLNYAPAMSDRGKPIGAYALVEFKDGGLQAEFMSADEIERVRSVSKAGRSGPWKDWPDEMWRKTVFRRLSKWLPLSSDKWEKALALDNADHDLTRASVQVESDSLNVQLGLKEPEPEVVEAEPVDEGTPVEGEDLFVGA